MKKLIEDQKTVKLNFCLPISLHEKLKAELLQVREKGYAIALEELESGLNALAAPIRNHEGEVVACVSVSGPSHRLTEEYINEIIPKVLKNSKQLSSELGYKRGF